MDLVNWYWLAMRLTALDLWNALPGPWWVKVLVLVITQVIPGPQDELLLLAVVAVCRKIKARRATRLWTATRGRLQPGPAPAW